MVWRHPDVAIDDPRPVPGSFNMADVRRLRAHVIKLRDMPEVMGIYDFSAFLNGPVLRSRRSPIWMLGQPFKGFPFIAFLLLRPMLLFSILLRRILPLVPLVPRLLLRPMLLRSERPLLLVPLRAMLQNALDSRGKGVMTDDASGASAGDGVAGNCEFTREEWDAPYRPIFEVLIKEVFKDPVVCKTILDQFPIPGEMVGVKSLSDDQLTVKMSVLHYSKLKGYEEKVSNITGFELQVPALKKQVFRLNDKLSFFDASFTKSKVKGKERKNKIKSLTKSLDNFHTEVARLSATLNQAITLEAEKDEEIL
nr:hypothetical protein [Tanacetum cinerariifolium]